MNLILFSHNFRILLAAADVITNIEINAAGFKIGGSVAGLIGTGLVITGSVLSLFPFIRIFKIYNFHCYLFAFLMKTYIFKKIKCTNLACII